MNIARNTKFLIIKRFEDDVNCGNTNFEWIKIWLSQWLLQFKQLQINPKKNFRDFKGIRTHDLFTVSAALLYHLSYGDPYTGSRPVCWVHLAITTATMISSLKIIKDFVIQSTQFNLRVIKTYEFFVRKVHSLVWTGLRNFTLWNNPDLTHF